MMLKKLYLIKHLKKSYIDVIEISKHQPKNMMNTSDKIKGQDYERNMCVIHKTSIK